MENLNELFALFVPVTAIVFGLVEFFKSALKLEGTSVTVMSFLVGAAIGGAVFAGWKFPETQQYVYGGLFILATGLVASGFYKFSASLKAR